MVEALRPTHSGFPGRLGYAVEELFDARGG